MFENVSLRKIKNCVQNCVLLHKNCLFQLHELVLVAADLCEHHMLKVATKPIV